MYIYIYIYVYTFCFICSFNSLIHLFIYLCLIQLRRAADALHYLSSNYYCLDIPIVTLVIRYTYSYYLDIPIVYYYYYYISYTYST